jgi:hypothetical protein
VNKIRQAIDVLAARGWTKGAFTDLSGRHCLQGALYEAHGVCPLRRGSVVGPLPSALAADVRLVNDVVEANYPERFGGVGVSRFNDHPETTVDDVVLVLEKAAVRRDELR